MNIITSTPPNKIITLEALKGNCDIIPFAFVRDSIDSWISLGTDNIKDYFIPYLHYVKILTKENIPIF